MPDRVVLFVDYQNVYSSARRAFHANAGPGRLGQTWPLAIGELICAKARPASNRRLEQVRVYRGVPSPRQDRTGSAASRRQMDAWRMDARVEIFPHTLLRSPDGSLREKGVDVHLAADLVDRAHRDLFDVAIIFSLDTDFEPAIEIARNLGVVVEVAAWRSDRRRTDRRLVRNRSIWCHWLNNDDYRRVRDRTSYVEPQLP